jgi:perosamine synthetase
MSNIKIPIYKPSLRGNEKKYVNECLDTNWISSRGHFVNDFESKFARKVGADHAVSVCNGTVALHLALVALGVGLGDEVIVPTLTYIAPVNAIAYTGAIPVFVDSQRESWQIDPDDIRRKITSKTKAIIAVHLYGQACEMETIVKIAKENGLFVIEDCAEAFGTYYKGKHVGVFGDISTFSFFGNKTITTGEGGMVISNNKTLAGRASHFKGQGLADHREYWHDVVGYNYRMTNIAAAIGLAQLENCDEIISRKREIAIAYISKSKKYPVEFHIEQPDSVHSYWMVSILVPHKQDRDSLRTKMSVDGIETRPVFFPVHTMPMYSRDFQVTPVAEDLAWRGINLPSWPDMTEADIDTVVASIGNFFQS